MIVLERCEICQNKLTTSEKVKYGHECQKCVDHLRRVLGRALAEALREDHTLN